MGIFFTLPLFLQIVLGLDAFETGLRMLPISIAMIVFSPVGAGLTQRLGPRRIVQAGFVVLSVGTLGLLGVIDVTLDGARFWVAMFAIGVGMGLVASQLGNVVQSSVGERDRGTAGGLQYTASQFGASLGTALIGAVVLSGLVGASPVRARQRRSHPRPR